MNVEQIMTRPVKTCRPGDTVDVAARLLSAGGCGCVPVVDGAGVALGILTAHDVCKASTSTLRPLNELRVADVMSKELHACCPHDSLQTAAEIIFAYRVRRLPVLDSRGRIVGLLLLNDLHRHDVIVFSAGGTMSTGQGA